MVIVGAMRHIESSDIHASVDDFAQRLEGGCRRTEGADNLRAAHG